MNYQAVEWTQRTDDAIKRAELIPIDVSNTKNKIKPKFKQWQYKGYFAIYPTVTDNEGTYGVQFNIDDGRAVINNQDFVVSGTSISNETYIWLQSDYVSGEVSAPEIKTSNIYPSYEDNKCKILLGRIVDNEIIQEHFGVVYGIIAGQCEEEEDE